MALSAKLSMRQSQSMVMTPQLLQSIRLLQYTQLELDRFVQQQIEINPLLDQRSADNDDVPRPWSDDDHPADIRSNAANSEESWSSGDLEVSSGAIAERMDTSLENVFPDDPGRRDDGVDTRKQAPGTGGANGTRMLSGSASEVDLEAIAASPHSLRDHILEQVSFSIRDPLERAIAWELMEMVGPDGYLEGDPYLLEESLGCTAHDIARTLATLQQFEPAGLFARDLAECLGLQLKRLDRFDPAMAALIDNLPLLAKRDFRALSQICGVDENDLVDMLTEIRTLDPRPGRAFDCGPTESIVHDVEIREAPDQRWHIELNPEALPKVIVNRDYYATVARGKLSTDEKTFLSECLQNATWLERSLDQRATTILKVATEIVRRQDGFFVHGVRALKPMTMKMVAEAINMHESTISRVSANKYILTPRGMFEFRYFFTVALGASEAGEDAHSSEAVRERIRSLIDGESPQSILSDDALVTMLKKEGIEIARRTVAKYRESMNIASSVQRRREKRAMAAAMT